MANEKASIAYADGTTDESVSSRPAERRISATNWHMSRCGVAPHIGRAAHAGLRDEHLAGGKSAVAELLVVAQALARNRKSAVCTAQVGGVLRVGIPHLSVHTRVCVCVAAATKRRMARQLTLAAPHRRLLARDVLASRRDEPEQVTLDETALLLRPVSPAAHGSVQSQRQRERAGTTVG